MGPAFNQVSEMIPTLMQTVSSPDFSLTRIWPDLEFAHPTLVIQFRLAQYSLVWTKRSRSTGPLYTIVTSKDRQV